MERYIGPRYAVGLWTMRTIHPTRARSLPYDCTLPRLIHSVSQHRTARALKTSAEQGTRLGNLPLTWPHTGWTEKMLLDVVPSHREPRTLGDKFAWRVTRLCR